jgi:hypothetical protein
MYKRMIIANSTIGIIQTSKATSLHPSFAIVRAASTNVSTSSFVL